MSFSELFEGPPANPANLAMSRAHVVAGSSQDSITVEEEYMLNELEQTSDELGFGGDYFIRATSAFAIPVAWEHRQQVPITHFNDGLDFKAELLTYGVVKIGNLKIGEYEFGVRALSLVFNDALLLPYLDRLEETDLLYVPAFAVDSISAA